MGLMDFFTPEAGQKRRNWLDAQLGGMWEYVPPELRPWMGVANEMNPVVSMERAGSSARAVADPNVKGWDKVAAVGDTASNMANAIAPVMLGSSGAVPAVQAVEDALMGFSAANPMAFAARDFVTDEFGGVGFRAYHGSPHDFDRFSLDKIGTGEGAQAYGHGLYFAESEGVARSYRDTLSRARHQDPEFWADAQLPRGLSVSEQDEYNMLGAEMLRRGNLPADEMARWRELRTKRDERETAIAAFKAQNPGRMYEVQINADPNDFLDWDKPLSEQPAAVRDALTGIYPDNMMGGDIARLMASDARDVAIMRGDNARTSLGASQEAASRSLQELGIPGIRYLDAGSRGAGDGSRNYVVFDDKLIEILRKYGLVPGMIGAGAYGMQPTEAQAGQ